MNRSLPRCLSALVTLLGSLPVVAQDPAPAKGPDKEVAEKIETLKDVVLDKKFARDNEGVQIIDSLLLKLKAGLDDKDQLAIVKALDGVFNLGPKVRPPDNTALYSGAVAALGYCGEEGAKVLKNAYLNKTRFPERKEWLPLREQLLKNLGRTKDESQVKFLTKEARTNHEAALQAAAGDALGNFDESKEPVRKEIVGELMVTYGELAEKAGQLGSQNIEAQNAKDRLAALEDKWKTTLGKLTRQNFATFSEWQKWYNKNKALPW
jgi:hypothetical protein